MVHVCVCVCVLKIIFDDVMTLVCVNDIHSQLGDYAVMTLFGSGLVSQPRLKFTPPAWHAMNMVS